MPKPRNPRRVVLEALRELVAFNRWAISRYDQRQTTTDDGRSWRPLRTDEKIENDAVKWRELARGCAGAARHYEQLAKFANERAFRLEFEARGLGHCLKEED